MNPVFEKGEDPDAPPYILGIITKIDKTSKAIEVSGMLSKVFFSKTIPYINDLTINISDMATASDICEVDLLNNLTNRLVQSKETFTNVGPTLLITNPYEKDPHLYTQKKIEHYIDLHAKNPPEFRKTIDEPHLYDIVLIAIEQLTKNNRNQAIVISGESGAGKTEAAKNSMGCITYYFQGRLKGPRRVSIINQEPLEKQIMSCNPILEAFGNSKTIRNDNSSRFGKYVKINVNMDNKEITGAMIQTYLLEKSRITKLASNERNYHIFYHLLYGAEESVLSKLHLVNDPSKYNYLNVSKCMKIKSIDDVELYKETIDCFHITGFSEEEIDLILKIIAAVLLLGNLKFVQKPSEVDIENKDTLNDICDLLSCDPEEMKKSFTVSVRVVAGNEYASSVKQEDAINYRDAFAKELYNRLFNWMIKKLNIRLNPKLLEKSEDDVPYKNDNIHYIGLLDIFGFECIEHNSLEQMCINYTNEKLQQIYIKDFFESEVEEFKREGLGDKVSMIKYQNNQHIIDLLDLTPTGLFIKLDDCSFQNKQDEYFVDLLKKEYAKNKTVKLPRLKRDFKLTIYHSAKNVVYDLTGFVVKNKDELKKTMQQVIINSKNEVLKNIFFNTMNADELKEEIEKLNAPGGKKDSKFLSGKFRNEMKELMDELKACECNYIRCLKPNEERKAFFVSPSLLFNQIKYLGIFDTIRVRKEGYPNRREYKVFNKGFEIVFPELCKLTETDRNISEKIIKELVPDIDELNKNSPAPLYLCGNTKIYMKQEFNIILENRKQEKLKKKIESEKIMRVAVVYLTKKNKKERIEKCITEIQKFYGINKYKIEKLAKIKKIKEIQAAYHTLIARKKFFQIRKNFRTIQSFIHTKKKVEEFNDKRKSIFYLSIRLNMFVLEIYERRRKKMKALAKYLLSKSVDRIIEIEYSKIWKRVHPFVLCLLARRKYQDIYKVGKLARENYSKNFVMDILQERLLLYKIQKRKKATKILANFALSKLSKRYFSRLRENMLVIQAYLKTHCEKRGAIKRVLGKFFDVEEADKKEMENSLEQKIFPYSSVNNTSNEDQNNELNDLLFSKGKLKSTKHKNRSQKILATCLSSGNMFVECNDDLKMKTLQKDKIINSALLSSLKISQRYPNASLPEYSNYSEPKMRIFSRVLAIDVMVNLGELSESNWEDEFMTLYESTMKSNCPVQVIELGGYHTLALNSRGKVYSWGWNNYSQCGTDPSSSITGLFLPPLVKDPKTEKFPRLPCVYYQTLIGPISPDQIFNAIDIQCGEEFSYVLTKDGNIFCFGYNEKSQLGIGSTFPMSNPILLNTLKGKCSKIKTTSNMTLILTNTSEVYYWVHSSLKTPHKKIVPMKLYLDPRITIVQIACGYNFAMLLSKTGIIYGFGSNSQGELGLYDEKEEDGHYHNDPSFKKDFYHYPEEITYLSKVLKEKITDIKCGFKHTVCLTSSRKVYSWGNNSFGQIGTGGTTNINLPTNINVETKIGVNKIIQISAGFRSTVFFTENRGIFYTGVLDRENMSKSPKKFLIKKKNEEVCDENRFGVVRILNTWNKSMSIFYATFADIRSVNAKLQNMHKIGIVLNTLASKWKNEMYDCPYIPSIANFFSPAFMKKG